MAVLTDITQEEARVLLGAYGWRELRSLAGIAGGSVNSNFAVESEAGRFFLRIYEERDLRGAEEETALLERLARAGVPTPAPLHKRDGSLVSVVRGKPAALYPWRQGGMRCQASVTSADAARVGEALGRVHLAGKDELGDAGRFRYEDLQIRLDRIARSGDERFAGRVPGLRASLDEAHRARDSGLPRGLVHGDLFRDNVLWDPSGGVSALLDFESACEGTYAFDLMVTVLAWCVGAALEPKLARALCEGYQRVRPLSEREKEGLCAEGRFAAMRFTITRITDFAMRASAGPGLVKDWQRFWNRHEALAALGPKGVREALGW